ncbi:MAG TPA: acylneuraminate cytidylyltransferase family protein [Campylobacterales bacterium]|nr:acylneuraminate cytidylyltransferase family protein [Campylobacterales bacterium]
MTIAFIPVRCGSKSIPFKNIKDFCGKPLVYWNLEALQNSSNIDKIFVATDCEEIKSVVNGFELSKVEVYDRDPQNANDIASTESVMLEFISKQNFNDNDLFFLVQATSPLTQTKDFDEALETLKNQKADSLLTCVRTKRFFWNSDGTPLNYNYCNRPRRQGFDGILMENGAFYINTIANIKRDKNRLSGKIAIYEMEEYKAVDIDEEDDWVIAEGLMKKYILKGSINAK